jgi:hypothetical protein
VCEVKTIAQQSPTIHRRRALAGVAWINAIAAIGGAVGLATGTLELGKNLNDRLPFASPVLGGIALAAVVAMPFTVVALLAWRGDDRTDTAAMIAGALLIGWIIVQLALLRAPSVLQAIYAAVGVAFFLYGRHQSDNDDTKEH